MGKLIVIEGTDASGKETQTNKLFLRLNAMGKNVRTISFPNYNSPACEPVKMYLSGKFGTDANAVNPYPVSTMYAIDRYASYKMDWEKNYKDDCIIVTDRYVTSNMIHQCAKLSDTSEKLEYLRWLVDLEYDKNKIPVPDMVIFLNMPPKDALSLMRGRESKFAKDIHESNELFLKKSYDNACYVAQLYKWKEIKCVDENGNLRTIEDISEEIYRLIEHLI